MAESMSLSAAVAWRLMDAVDGTTERELSQQGVATVRMVDPDGTVWVRLPGSTIDTPANGTVTAAVSPGQTVEYRIESNRLSVVGNASDPAAGVSGVREVTGTVERVERRVESVRTELVEADRVQARELAAERADIGELQAATADIATLRADSAKVHDLTADQLSAAAGYVEELTAGDVTAANIIADKAKLAQLDVQQIATDHATIGQLDANFAHADMANVSNAWIENGTVRDGAITNAMINSVSANKLTAGTIDASNITVTNLNADNITTGTINGQRIGEGSLSLSKLEDDVYTETEVDAKLATMQAEIDGAIETWTGTDVPTLNNSPASGWTTADERDRHVGDVYFVVNSQSQQNGYNYRFTKTGSTYSWQLIKDSDVTNALQRLTDAEGRIGTIEQFDSDISSWKTDTDEELGSIKSAATTLAGRVTTAEGQIATKVEQSTFNELSQTVGQNSASITSLTTTTTELRNDLDNIEVGARNLLRHSDDPKVNSEYYLVRSTAEDGGVIRITPTTSYALAASRSRYLDFSEFGEGEYTLSFDARLADAETTYTKVNLVAYLGYSAESVWNNTGFNASVNHRYLGKTVPTDELTTEWKRFHYTYSSTADMTGGSLVPTDGCSLRAEFYCGGSSVPIEVRRVKLERGTMATDWSPAPEDVERKPNILRGTNQRVELIPFEQTSTAVWSDGTWSVGSGNATNGDAELVEIDDGPDGQLYAFRAWSVNTNNKDVAQGGIDIFAAGTQYQVSFYARLTPGVEQESARAQFRLHGYNTADATSTSAQKTYSFTLDSTEWKLFSYNLTLTEAQLAHENKGKRVLFGALGKGDVQFCGVKLEQSDYVTAWAPSPFDSASITSVSTVSAKVSEITQTVDGITTRVGELETTVEGKADGSAVETISNNLSTLEQDVGTFKTTVASTYATKEALSDAETTLQGAIDTKAASSDLTALTTRVTTAESTIEQHSDSIALKANSTDVYTKTESDDLITTEVTNRNAAISAATEAIELSVSETYSTKTEASQMAQPNLTPFFSSHNDDGTYPVGNADGYWQPSNDKAYNRACFTALEDGWAHLEACNNAQKEFVPPFIESLKSGDKVTMMVEWRNASQTGDGPNFYTRNYANNVQLNTNWYFLTTASGESGTAYRTFTVSGATGEAAWNGLANVTFTAKNSSSTWTGDIRISFYVGDYRGPYKPYSGEQLYATQTNLEAAKAAIKVTTDGITQEVSKKANSATIISTINQSAESVQIQASKVEIDGTAVFNAIKDSADAAYDAKGAAATVQTNLDGLVGVRLTLTRDNWTDSQWDGYETIGHTDSWSNQHVAAGGATSSTGLGSNELRVGDLIVVNGVSTDTKNTHSITIKVTSAPSSATSKIAATTVTATNSTGIEIGARNLLRKTGTLEAADVVRTRSTVPETGVIRLTPTSSAAYAKFIVDYLDYADFADTSVVVSLEARLADVESTYTAANNVIVYVGVQSPSRINSIFGSISDAYGSKTQTPTLTTTEWTRLTFAFNIPANLTSGNADALVAGNMFTVQLAENGSRSPIEIRRVKLEKGTKATDWTLAPEDVDSAIAAVSEVANAAAPKSDTVKRTQRIWYRSNSATAPSTPGTASSNWVTKADDGNAAWTKMHVAISGTHKYIYTCEQYEMANGTVGYTSVLLDNTITVIDGGNIITGSVKANSIDATSGTFDTANIPALTADHIKANVISAVNNGTGTINADKINVSSITIGPSQVTGLQTALDNKADEADIPTKVSDLTNDSGYATTDAIPTDISELNNDTGFITESDLPDATDFYGTCATEAGTAAKVVVCDGFVPSVGARLTVRCTTANTTNAPTLTIKDGTEAVLLSAAAVWFNNAVTSGSNIARWGANATLHFVWDGTVWHLDEKPPSYKTTSSTAAATRAKAATATGALVVNGTHATIGFSTANTYAANTVQLNLSGTGALNVARNNVNTSTTNTLLWDANTVLTFVLQGTTWFLADNGTRTMSEDAAKTATNYISADSTGIKIANADPATATTYQHLTATSTEFVVEGDSMLEMGGSEVRIGETTGAHTVIDQDSIDMMAAERTIFTLEGTEDVETWETGTGTTTTDTSRMLVGGGGWSTGAFQIVRREFHQTSGVEYRDYTTTAEMALDTDNDGESDMYVRLMDGSPRILQAKAPNIVLQDTSDTSHIYATDDLAALLDLLLTPATDNWALATGVTSATIHSCRSNGVALSVYGQNITLASSLAVGGQVVLGNLAAGFRPPEMIHVPALSYQANVSGAIVQISAGGVITLTNRSSAAIATSTRIAFSMTVAL